MAAVMMQATPLAEATGAAVFCALGLRLLAFRSRGSTSAEGPEATVREDSLPLTSTTSTLPSTGTLRQEQQSSFIAGVLLFLASQAMSTASSLDDGAEGLNSQRTAILSTALPICWLVQLFFDIEMPSSAQTASYWCSFFGAGLLQWSAPWPLKGAASGSLGIKGDSSGLGPLVELHAYLLVCLLCLGVCSGLASNHASDKRHRNGGSNGSDAFSLLLVLTAGAGAAASELALTYGAEASMDENEAKSGALALLVAMILIALVLRCSHHCLQERQLPLADFAPLLLGFIAIFRVAQTVLLFRDVSWHVSSDEAKKGMPMPRLRACLTGATVLIVTILAIYRKMVLYGGTSDTNDYSMLSTRSVDADERGLNKPFASFGHAQAKKGTSRPSEDGRVTAKRHWLFELAQSKVAHKAFEWTGVLICAVSYYAGITRALFLITPPEVLATAPSVERSNLQLITYLASVGMPLASFFLVIFSVIIPLFKFATTFLVMHPPSWVTRMQHARFCKLLCAMSPYQMSDIFLVMLILAYLNTGFAVKGNSGEGYDCTLCAGFKSFFIYCFVSIFVAQVLEIEHEQALEERLDDEDDKESTLSPELSISGSNISQGAKAKGVDRRGMYVVTKRAAVVPTVHVSGTKEIDTELRPGDLIEILEVEENKSERRIRGKVANPPGWISLQDEKDGYRWAERVDGELALEEHIVKLVFFASMWLLCMFTLLFLPSPPMSLQARSGGVIVFMQNPTLPNLVHALWSKSMFFTGLMIVVLVVTPVCFVLVTFTRMMVFKNELSPILARRLWLMEQILKPWVMGDVAAVSITSLFLSIQEPTTDFVYLCVRLPHVPIGFLACLGMGIASWGLRWCTLPLRPRTNEEKQLESPQGAVAGPNEKLTTMRVGKLVWPELAVWIFWFTCFWQLGPHSGPSVRSLDDLNRVLSQEVPRVNLLLLENVPASIGDCDEVRKRHQEEHLQVARAGDGKDNDCKPVPLKPIYVSALDLHAKLSFIDGLSTLRISNLDVVPESSSGILETPNKPGYNGLQRWAIRVKAKFSGLKIWAEMDRGGLNWVNDYICCQNPYHIQLQLSALCMSGVGFQGNVTVDDFHIDPVNLKTAWNGKSSGHLFKIEMPDRKDLVHEAIKSHLEDLLVQKTGGATPIKPGLPTVSLTSVLNKILQFNGGVTRCPEF